MAGSFGKNPADDMTEEELAVYRMLSAFENEHQNTRLRYYKRFNLVTRLKPEEFKTIYRSKVLVSLLEELFPNNDSFSSLITELSQKHSHLIKDILKNSKSDRLKLRLIQLGYHTGIEDINKLAKSDDENIRCYIASRCGIETLKELRADSSKKVRLAAYRRLGVDEYLDEMLEDGCHDIRYEAAKAAPLYYPKFKSMSDELSKKVFREIARKINVKDIPYILGNRNVNESYIKKMLEFRMAHGNIDFIDEKIEEEKNV